MGIEIYLNYNYIIPNKPLTSDFNVYSLVLYNFAISDIFLARIMD